MSDWDERYGGGEYTTAELSPLLALQSRLGLAGRALDLVCGSGRHAIYPG